MILKWKILFDPLQAQYYDCVFDSEGSHKFVRVKEVGSTMQEQFEAQLRHLSEQISRLCKQEKQAWQTFDKYTGNFAKLIKDMEQRTEEQVRCFLYEIACTGEKNRCLFNPS